MQGSARTALLLVAASLLVAAPTSAQIDTGSIVGTVSDASGAVLPGATVTALQEGTGYTSTTTTNAIEAFNVFNWTNYGLPATSVANAATFGRITTSLQDPRELQFAVKLYY